MPLPPRGKQGIMFRCCWNTPPSPILQLLLPKPEGSKSDVSTESSTSQIAAKTEQAARSPSSEASLTIPASSPLASPPSRLALDFERSEESIDSSIFTFVVDESSEYMGLIFDRTTLYSWNFSSFAVEEYMKLQLPSDINGSPREKSLFWASYQVDWLRNRYIARPLNLAKSQ